MRRKFISAITAFLFAALFSAPALAVSETTVPPSTMAEEFEVETAVEATTTTTLPNGSIYFENFSELYDYWYKTADSENAYPDYVCGVWSIDGTMDNLMVALITGENGEKGKEEILSLIENDESVTFTYKTHTYAEMYEAKEKILKRLVELTDSGIAPSWSIGIDEMENVVHVDIDTSVPEVQELMSECEKEYGDMVVFKYENTISFDHAVVHAGRVDVDGPENTDIGAPIPAGGDNVGLLTEAPEGDMPDWYYTTAGESAETGEIMTVTTTFQTADYKSNVLIWAAAAGVILLLVAAGIVGAKRKRLAQTSAGTLETAEKLNTAQVEAMLRMGIETPDSDVLEKIMKEIE